MMLMLAAVTTIAAAGSSAAIGLVSRIVAVLEQHPAPIGGPRWHAEPEERQPREAHEREREVQDDVAQR